MDVLPRCIMSVKPTRSYVAILLGRGKHNVGRWLSYKGLLSLVIDARLGLLGCGEVAIKHGIVGLYLVDMIALNWRREAGVRSNRHGRESVQWVLRVVLWIGICFGQ